MSVSVGTLQIDLRAETASFTSEMSKASHLSAKTANDIKRSLDKIAVAGVAMGAAIARGTAEVIKDALNSANAMGKLAQAAGTTSEHFTELKYAAGLAGVEQDRLAKGLERLSRNAFQAQNGNLQMERIWNRLGISYADANGKLKDSGAIMDQIALKFAKMKDGAGKSALAYAFFSKQGPELIPFLNQYGLHQEAMNEESRRLGLVLSTSTTESAARAHDVLVKLHDAAEGLGFAVLGATLPALEKLGDRLIEIAVDANIPDLAKAFGEKVSTAVDVLGNALDFAAKHAHALLVTMEALAGLKIAAIAIPVIGDIAGGGMAKAGEGIARFLIGFAGIGKLIPVLAQFGSWIKYTASSIGMLAAEEGVGAAATYVLGGAVAAMGGPIGIAIAAIAGLGIAIYKFRDSTFSLGNNTYELRDIWSASWILMGKAFAPVKSGFKELIDYMRKLWGEFTSWFGATWIVDEFKAAFGKAFEWAEKILGMLTPKVVIDALNEAKQRREASEKGRAPKDFGTPKPNAYPAPDTSGLSSHPDYFKDLITKLTDAGKAQQAYLDVIDGTPEAIQAANIARLAKAQIDAINKQRNDEGTKSISKQQEAQITQLITTREMTKALVDYGREIVGQQHGADLSIKQTRAMAAANLEGDAAIRRATVSNAILALQYNRATGELQKMTPELERLKAYLTEQANISLIASANKEIDGLRDQLTQRQILTAATLQGIDAQRQAELQAKLLPLDRDIGHMNPGPAQDALLKKRAGIVALAQAQWDANDAERAASLLSPSQQYETEADALNHAVIALSAMGDGAITYGEQLDILEKQQEMFNNATDRTIQLLLGEGSATDGVKAFFLEMQKQAQTTASILYDTFNGAFNRLADGITGIMTAANGYKRRDAINQMMTSFQDLSKQMLDSSLKKGMQSGLGALGNMFGINLGSAIAGKPDGSSSAKALWVRMEHAGAKVMSMFGIGKGAPTVSSGTPGFSFGSSGANIFSSIGGKIASLFGMGKKSPGAQASIIPDTTAIGLDDLIPMGTDLGMPQSSLFSGIGGVGGDQTNTQVVRPQQSNAGGIVSQIAQIALGLLIPHADGGFVSPSSAYLVGERGPEILAGASGRIFSNADSRRMLSGGDTHTHTWNVDARGSNDPAQVTAQINRAMANAVPQIAAVVFHGVKDQPLRRPSMAPR